MNILVCIKRIALVGSQIVLTADATDVDTSKLGFQLSHMPADGRLARLQLARGGKKTALLEDGQERAYKRPVEQVIHT